MTNITGGTEMSKAGVEAFAAKAVADKTFRQKIKKIPTQRWWATI